MKKYLLKAIAIVAAMGFCSTNAMAADPDLENDYTLVKSFAAGGSDEAVITLSSTALSYKVNSQNLFPISSPEGLDWIALQGMSGYQSGGSGNGWWNRTNYGLYCHGAGRSASINYSELTTGWIVAITCTQTASNVVTMVENASAYSLTNSADGKTVFATIVAAEGAHVDFAGNKNGMSISSIAIYKPTKEVKTVNYTINYKLGDNTVKTVEESTVAGSTVNILESFKDGDKKYIREDGENASFVANSDTTVIVKVRESDVYNYTVNFVAGDVIKSVNGKVFAGEAAKVYVPRYIFDEANKTLYSYKTAYEFNYTFTPASDNAVENLTFNAEETNSNAYFFSEAEDIEGVTPYEDGFTQIRMANGAVGIADSVAVAPLKPGIYTLTSSSRSGSTDFYVDGEKVFNLTSTGAVVTETSDEFTVKENTKLFAKNVLNANNSNYFDYVLIRKTGDYKYLDVESTLPDTLSYVKGTPEDEKPKLSEYVKVSTNALKTVAAFYTTAKVEAGADKAAVEYTAYETEDAAKAAMSEPGLYYCFGRIVGLFSMTDVNDYKEVFTDTIVVEVKEAEAEPVSAHTWDLTKWSEATINNLKAEAAKEEIEDMGEGKTNVKAENGATWSDHEKAAQTEASKYCTTYAASKDNCFWFFGSANADGQLEANGQVIEELSGLTFPTDAYNKARSIAIAVNYGSTSLGTYEGGSYFWLGGKDKDCFVIKNVKAGSVITMGVESHKPAEARGVKLTLDGTELTDPDGNAVAAPTVYAEQTWQVPGGALVAGAKGDALSADAGDEVVDITVHNTNGCHIYFIDAEIGEPTPDAIQTVEAETEAVKAVKFIKDGKLIIVSGGKQFNAAGAQVK